MEIAAVVPTHTNAIGDDPHFTRRFPPSPAPGRSDSVGSGDKKELDIEELGSTEVPESLSKHWDSSVEPVEHGPIGQFSFSLVLLRRQPSPSTELTFLLGQSRPSLDDSMSICRALSTLLSDRTIGS